MEYIQRIREKVGQDTVLIPATAIVILNHDGKVLLHLRNDSNTWGLPGGLMDIGETVVEGARRELFEETGLIAKNFQIFGIFSGPHFEVKYSNGDHNAPVILGFFTSDYAGKITESEESPIIDFFDFAELPKNMNHFHQSFIDGYLKFTANNSTSVILA